MSEHFPPPDNPCEPEPIEVVGAIITSAEVPPRGRTVVLTAIVHERTVLEDAEEPKPLLRPTALRFELSRDKRLVREFYRAAGVRRVPTRTCVYEVDPKGGAFYIVLQGTLVGEDNLPDTAPIGRALVIENVDVTSLMPKKRI